MCFPVCYRDSPDTGLASESTLQSLLHFYFGETSPDNWVPAVRDVRTLNTLGGSVYILS